MFDTENTRGTNMSMNEKKVIASFIKRIISDMADDPDAPERLRLDAKATIMCAAIRDYCLELSRFTTSLKENEEDMKKLRDTVEYLELAKTGMETFFQSIGFSVDGMEDTK